MADTDPPPLVGHPGSSGPNSPFYDDPLRGHPWMTADERDARRAKRHKLWLSRLSETDWSRIRALADQVTTGFSPARLDDLDARGIAIGVCAVGEEKLLSGERVGTVRDGAVAVLVWVKD